MKILIVTYGLNTIGGLQSWQHAFIHELQARGKEVTVLEMYDYSELLPEKKVEREWNESITIIKCNGPIIQRSINPKTNVHALGIIFNIKGKLKLSSFLKKEKFDIVLLTDPNFSFNFLKSDLRKNNLIVQFHNSFDRFIKTSKIRYWLTLRRMDSFKKFVLLSKGDKEHAISTGISGTIVDYNYNFINETRFEKFYKDSSKINKQILIVGKLKNAHKQMDHILKAFSQINKELSKDWTIKVIGEGESKNDLLKLAHDLNIRDKVLFEGQKDNPTSDYFESDFFVLSSDYEGLPMTLVESVYANLPIVAYDCSPSISDVIIDGFNGLIVEKNNIQGLSECMSYLMTNTQELNRMSKNQEDIRSKFSTSSIFEKWEAIFEEVMR